MLCQCHRMTSEVDGHSDPCTQSPPTTTRGDYIEYVCNIACIAQLDAQLRKILKLVEHTYHDTGD